MISNDDGNSILRRIDENEEEVEIEYNLNGTGYHYMNMETDFTKIPSTSGYSIRDIFTDWSQSVVIDNSRNLSPYS